MRRVVCSKVWGLGQLHQERGGHRGARSSVGRGEQRVRVIVQRRSYPPLSLCQWLRFFDKCGEVSRGVFECEYARVFNELSEGGYLCPWGFPGVPGGLVRGVLLAVSYVRFRIGGIFL